MYVTVSLPQKQSNRAHTGGRSLRRGLRRVPLCGRDGAASMDDSRSTAGRKQRRTCRPDFFLAWEQKGAPWGAAPAPGHVPVQRRLSANKFDYSASQGRHGLAPQLVWS